MTDREILTWLDEVEAEFRELARELMEILHQLDPDAAAEIERLAGQ